MNRPNSDELQLQIQARLVEEISRRDREFETLINLMEEIVFHCDADGRIMLVNSAWTDRTGFETESTVGQHIGSYIPNARQSNALQGALQHSAPISMDIELQTRFGNLRSCNLKARRDGDSWYGSMFDVTEQNLTLRALRESENRARKLSLVAKRTDNLVVITDAEGRIEWVNEGFERRTGYMLAEVSGCRPGEILQGPLTSAEAQQSMGSALERGEGFTVEVVNYDRKRTPYWVSIDCSPVFDETGQLQNFIAIERDITESKEVAEAMLKAKEEAEALTDARTRFVANMSHEIRTPLNAILGMTSVLERTRLSVEQRGCLEIVRSSGKALLELVTDVLDFSKLESGQLQFDAVSFQIVDVFEEAVEIITPALYEKRLTLSLEIRDDVPLRATGDPHRLRQVVLNLLSNAVKFTGEGGVRIQVDWRTSVQGQEEGLLCVTVEDTGVGIDSDRIDALFDEFTQADPSTTREFGGTGLGLAICREICEQSGGSIRAESKPGAGTAFHFEFCLKSEVGITAPAPSCTIEYPAHQHRLGAVMKAVPQVYGGRIISSPDTKEAQVIKPGHAEGCPIDLGNLRGVVTPARIWKAACQAAGWTHKDSNLQEQVDNFSGLHVLVAEDVLANQVVIKAILEGLGVTAITLVENGQDAVDAAREKRFDLVLLDMHMPVLDGLAACSKIREAPLEGQPYIVSVSADVTTEARALAKKAGVNECLAKPITRAEFETVLRKVSA